MRYRAPADTTAIHLTSGTLTVDKDGFVKTNGDPSQGDIIALTSNGFVAEPEETKTETAKATEPAAPTKAKA